MKTACDLFIEQGVSHGLKDLRVHSKGEFAYITCPGVGVEDMFELLAVI